MRKMPRKVTEAVDDKETQEKRSREISLPTPKATLAMAPSGRSSFYQIGFFVLLTLQIATLAGAGVYFFVLAPRAQEEAATPQAQETPAPAGVAQPTPAEPAPAAEEAAGGACPPCGAPTQQFTGLGISFCYPQDAGEASGFGPLTTTIQGDKVYIHKEGDPVDWGQSVEVFSKDADDTLAIAIQKEFLEGIDEFECWPHWLDDEGPIQKAVISYEGVGEMEGDVPPWEEHGCPQGYSVSNGISYFWYDTTHPTTFLYISIGQYQFSADCLWEDTIEVL